MKQINLCIIAALCSATVVAESTSNDVIFVTIDSPRSIVVSNPLVKSRSTNNAAPVPSECRSAEFDPDGNWGPVSHGAQLSVRITNSVSRLGDTVDALVILRNTTTNELMLLGAGPSWISLTVTNEQTKAVWHSPFPGSISGPMGSKIPPRSQVKYFCNLNSAITNAGMFSVTARRVVNVGGEGAFEIHSGTDTFKIER